MNDEQSQRDADRSRLALLSILEDEKLARMELQASEERLRLSTELAHVAVWEYDFTTNSMSRSKNHDALYGLEWQHAWDLDTFTNSIHPEDRDFSNQMIQRSVSPGGPDEYTFDFRVVYPDRSLHWLSVVGQVIERNSEGAGMIVRGCLIEITDRKNAEQARIESETRYQTLFDNSMDAILLTAPDGRILEVNQATCTMFGRTAEEIKEIGRNGLVDLTDPRLAGALKEREQNGFVQAELTMIRANGEKFPAEISSTIYADAEGRQRTSMIIRDISERKRTEEKLYWANKLFSTTFYQSPVAAALTKLPDRTVVDMNQACESLFGYSRDEMIHNQVTEFRIWKDPGEQQEVFNELLSTGSIKDYEFEFTTKSGQPGRGLFYAELIAQQDEVYILLKFIDLTARRETEAELRNAEEKFSKAFFASPVGLTITRISDGKFIDVNDAFLRMFEFTRKETIGNNSVALNMLTYEARRDLISEQLRTGGMTHYELLTRSKSGKGINLLFSSRPIEVDGEACHLTTMIDITDRKQAEELLRSTMNRLIETEEQLRREAAQQLHDQVGQNLTALTINLNFLRHRKPGVSNEEEERRLTDSLRLLDDTVDRIRNVMTDLRPSILDDYGLYAALSWSTTKFTERTHIPVKLIGGDVKKRPPLPVEYALFRISQEALHNVLKHAHAGQVIIELSHARGILTLSIQDDGVGFDPQKIWKDRDKGFGLINIAERMKAMGGSVEVQSNPGKGTKILLRIKYKKR